VGWLSRRHPTPTDIASLSRSTLPLQGRVTQTYQYAFSLFSSAKGVRSRM